MIKKILFPILMMFGIILSAQIPQGYYDGCETVNGEELKTVLHNIIDNHTEMSYNALRDYVLKDTDEDENNTNNIILLYTGWSISKNSFGGGASDWNREHVWAKSHGGFDNNPPAGTDAHHIRPTDASVNSRRGNLDFDNGGSAYTDGDGATGCFVDGDSWEPRDEVKGDVARMIFYMEVRYEGTGGEPDLEMVDYVDSSPSGQPLHGKKSTLLAWHHEDPVSDWEIRRNNRVYNYQNNRNPFIDHPDFVGRVWEGVNSDDITIAPKIFLNIYPNPFNPSTTISFETTNLSKDTKIEIFNMKGQKIKNLEFEDMKQGINNIVWNGTDDKGSNVASGIYFCKLNSGDKTLLRKMLLMK